MKTTVTLPNFSISRGQLPPDVAAGGRARRLGRRLRSIGGWAVLGAFFFVIGAWIALPTEAIAWRIGYEAERAGYQVEIGDLSVRPWGAIKLYDVRWTFAPSRPDSIPRQYLLEQVNVRVRLLRLLAGTMDVQVETHKGDARIWGRYVRTSEASSVEVDVDELGLYDIPKATQELGVPLVGLVGIQANLSLPEHKLSKAEGSIAIVCAACKAGDGEAKLYVPGATGLTKEGITIPEIDLGTLTGTFNVKGGQAELNPPIETTSDDLTFSVNGRIDLKDPLEKTQFELVIKLSLSEAFQERSEGLRFMYQGANPKTKLDPPEQGLGFKLNGSVARPQLIGIKSKTAADRRAERREKQRQREATQRSRPSKPKAKPETRTTRDKEKDATAEEVKAPPSEPAANDRPEINIEPNPDANGPDPIVEEFPPPPPPEAEIPDEVPHEEVPIEIPEGVLEPIDQGSDPPVDLGAGEVFEE